MKIYHPPHIFIDETHYFLTARTYKKQNVFDAEHKKAILLNSLKAEFQKCGFKLFAWVILNNHYHIEFKVKRAIDLSKIMNTVHGRVSFFINKLDGSRGRKVFQNYWDHGIRDEIDFWKHFNYIHHNPIKHNYAERPEDYKFSSYCEWLKNKGNVWLNSCFEKYPIIDFTIDEDE